MPVVRMIALVAISVLAQCEATNSATITALKNQYCDALLDGPLEEGDKDHLVSVVEALSDVGDRDHRLCLNSQGGSFEEALRIIKFLNGGGASLTTVVDKGAECFSACALIFMFGHHNEGDAMDWPQRELHVSGTLGFHSPHIELNVANNSQTLLSKAYREGVKAIGHLLDIDWDDWFPKPLLIDMLKTEPNDTTSADTIARAAAWEIGLVGYKMPTQLTLVDLEWACLNVTRTRKNRWLSRWWNDGEGGEFGENSTPKTKDATALKFVNNKYRAVFSGFGSEGSYKCTVDVFKSKDGKLYLAVNFDAGSTPVPAKDDLAKAVAENLLLSTEPLWKTYPSTTNLRDIAAP